MHNGLGIFRMTVLMGLDCRLYWKLQSCASSCTAPHNHDYTALEAN